MNQETWTPPTRVKLGSLWTSVMFLYLYADYFYLYVPGKLNAVENGKLGPLESYADTGVLIISLMLALPALMTAMSILLPFRFAKWLNLATGIFYSVIVALTLPDAALFYQVFCIGEIALTLTVAGMALRWKKNSR